jgi:hypothetical protein
MGAANYQEAAMKTQVRLVPLPVSTSFAPLGALGYCLTRSGFLDVVWQTLDLPLKTVAHRPEAKLLDVLVSIFTGCRAISQINSRLRPDVALARAWGRRRFADQATVARTLDAFEMAQINQLRAGSEALFRREGLSLRHDLSADWLWLDIDLTPLPISKQAEGSTKGKFGEKTDTAGSWHAYMHPSITRRCFPACTQASKRVVRVTYRPCKPWSISWHSQRSNASTRSCVPMRVLAAMRISTKSWQPTGKC